MSKKVVIIGAGFGGLATANLLAKAGFNVSVYEAHSSPGGRAGELTIDGFRFDTGPSWFLMPDVYEHYFSLLGEDSNSLLKIKRLDPAYRVFFENSPPVLISGDTTKNQRVFEEIEPGAGARLSRYLIQAEKTYRIAVNGFLYDTLTLKNMVSLKNLSIAPRLLSALLVPMDRYVGSFFRDKRLHQILEYPTVFLGSSPFETPSIYRLMSHLDFNQGVFFPEKGIYSLVGVLEGIGNELGVEYYYDAPVKRIVTNDKVASGIELEDGRKVEADIVISNADLHYTETSLLPPRLQTYPQSYWDKKQPAPSALLMYLGIKGSLPELQHHNLFFIDDWKENFKAIYESRDWPLPASMYVSRTSATDPTAAPSGCENIFVLVPGPSGEMNGADLSELADTYIDQLVKMSGVSDLKERIIVKKLYGPNDFGDDFHAWQNTALGLSHVLKQSASMRPANASKKVSNLYYVGASTSPGIGLPMCLIGAELVLKLITGSTTKGPLKDIPNYV